MPDIQLGDPVIDLANGRSMVVVDDHGETAAEWSHRNGYNLLENYGNERCGTADTDRVYECIYATSLQSEPSKTYAFPESRLGRPAIERASDDYGRVYDEVVRDVLEELFALASTLDEDWEVEPHGFQDALAKLTKNSSLNEGAVAEARELATVDAVIGGDE